MAYIDKYVARRPNIGATAAVIAIEAVLIIAVVRGLGVTFLPRGIPGNPVGIDMPLPKPSPPPEKPPAVRHDPHLTTPPPLAPPVGGLGKPVDPLPLDPPRTVTVPIDPPVPPQPPTPVSPGKPAIPRGNPAGWVSSSDYPVRELREASQGRVATCRVTSSSGYPGLDDATCNLVAHRARFTPAMGIDGHPSAGSYSGTIRWVIPD